MPSAIWLYAQEISNSESSLHLFLDIPFGNCNVSLPLHFLLQLL